MLPDPQPSESGRSKHVPVESRNISYLPGIDHLRAFAALLIIFYHGNQILTRDERARQLLPPVAWPIAKEPFSALVIEGHTAVGLFMVLSGFIFAFGVLDREVDYRLFLKNRFLRTYPLFLVLLALGCCAYPASVSFERLLMTLFGLANNQASLQLLPFSGMFWTIAVEWQFYVIFPFLIRFMRPRLARNAAAMILFLAFSRWLAFQNGADPRDISYWTIVGRLDQLLIGMVAGYYYRTFNVRLLRWLLLPASLVVLGSLFFFNRKLGGWPESNPYKLVWVTWEGAAWGFFAVCYLASAASLPARLSRVLSALGAVSYSIYLWHWPAVSTISRKVWWWHWLKDPMRNALFNTVVVIIPCVVAFAFLSYNLIEKPFLRLRVRYLSDSPPPSP